MKKIIVMLITMLIMSCTTSVKSIKPITNEPYRVVEVSEQPALSQAPEIANTEQPLHMFVVMIVAVVASCACCVFYTRAIDRKDRQKRQTDDTDETTVING